MIKSQAQFEAGLDQSFLYLKKKQVLELTSSFISTWRPVACKALCLALCLEERLDGSKCAEGVTLVPWCLSACLGSGQSVIAVLCSPQL